MPHSDRLTLAAEAGAFALPEDGDVLVLRAIPSDFHALVPRERLRLAQSFRPVHDALAAEGLAVATSAEAAATGPVGLVVVHLTRSRAESLRMVAVGLRLLAPGRTLVVTGAKADGIEALARSVAAALPLGGAFVKAHGRVVWLERPGSLPPEVAGWERAAQPAPNAEGFVTAPGMFSPEHSDPASRRLAEAVAGRLTGRVADLGAGWGGLAYRVLADNPGITALDLHEAELRALEAARLNVPDPRASFHWSDATRLGGADCEAVVMNPPFHQGRAAEPDLGAAFIAAARRMLRPQGRLFLVANRQLPYEAPLEAGFRRVTRLDEAGPYKLFEAVAPRRR